MDYIFAVTVLASLNAYDSLTGTKFSLKNQCIFNNWEEHRLIKNTNVNCLHEDNLTLIINLSRLCLLINVFFF
jgi:hypothetical protein